MLWMSSERLYHLSKETKMKRKRKAFGISFVKVKLVLVNIRFRLDISIPIMVTIPSTEFGAWHSVSHVRFLDTFLFWRFINQHVSKLFMMHNTIYIEICFCSKRKKKLYIYIYILLSNFTINILKYKY